ncbi:MAG: UvrB/UvrC motif-containing protein, partial [Eubacterium sp.]|nr:UvrB/UvrC motif-containing protein [Eubacterium sp.]
MRCEHCNEREATTHIKKNINGNKTEMHLCSECAAKLGVAEEFSAESFFADTFFGNLLGAGIPSMNVLSGVERCDCCGSSFNDIVKSGAVGCAHCYEKFADKLEPSIVKMHGKTKHVGKHVTYTVDETEKTAATVDTVQSLKEALKQAVKEQRFEDAAELRDK